MSDAPRMEVWFRRAWDPARTQLEGLSPAAGVARFIDWRVTPWPVDGGVPPAIGDALAEALTGAGAVAFRWAGELPPTAEATLVTPPSRGMLRRVADEFAHRWPSPVVVATKPVVARLIFDWGWEVQAQAALVLAPGADLTEPLRAALAGRRTWTDFGFPPPARALLTPAVDGSGALLSAATADALGAVLDGFARALARAGIEVADGV